MPMRESGRTAQLFSDARGFPARMAAVLFADGEMWYTSWEPCEKLRDALLAWRDQQIMAWELLAVALGVSTFAEQLKGRRVRAWVDNTGGKNALRAGAAKATDHSLVVHALWLHAARFGYGLWIERVASKDNISDLPSRESYRLLEEMGAAWVEPKLDNAFLETAE